MIIGMNSSAIILSIMGTVVSTLISPTPEASFAATWTFIESHPSIIGHVLIYCLCGAFGQYVIFHVIKEHGAPTFAKMMLMRQVHIFRNLFR